MATEVTGMGVAHGRAWCRGTPGWARALVAAACVAATAAGAQEPATLGRESVPAAGRAVVALTIAEPGRYALLAESRPGVALQLVDRMAGPGEVSGVAGERDGRLDLFLDRGEFRVRTFGPRVAAGEARLAVRPFRELHGATPPRLPELAPLAVELDDFEQVSWWIDVRERRRVAIEAAGRHLADLRLWRDGNWLVAAAPGRATIETESGRPLALCRLGADLEPGVYLVTAYGGPSQPWSRGGRERPLHLRMGVARDAVATRERRTVGPFGFERVLVPGRADFFRLELAEATDAALELAPWQESAPFPEAQTTAAIGADSMPPVAELRPAGRDGWSVVTVRARPGTPYVLQHFATLRQPALSGRGATWLGTVHSGAPADSIDATGLVVELDARGGYRAVAKQVVTLGGGAAWARRFNLLDTATLLVEVAEAATYELAASGSAARFRLEPLWLAPPEGYEAPPSRPAPAEWSLDPGLYRLTLEPVERGIVRVSLRQRGLLDPLLGAIGIGDGDATTPVLAALDFGVVDLSPKRSYQWLLGAQPGVAVGAVVRPLPLDLEASLPVALLPGQEVELAARAGERGAVSARAEDGGRLPLAVDGGEWVEETDLDAGRHVVRVRNDRAGTVLVSLGLEPASRRPSGALPPLPPAALAALPAFERLGAEGAGGEELGRRAAALDLARDEARTFLVEAEAPALWRAETSGLLATEATLRTRTVPELARAAENGIGRNAALATYLRAGEYQLTVRALGASAGHLGLVLARTAIGDGGWLADGVPARARLDPGAAVAYGFRVERAGLHRLRAWGLARDFDFRLEDADGWPVAAPVVRGEVTLDLDAGDYRVLVLPQPVPARALTVVERLPEPVELAGHGPHALPLDVERAHLWTEPAEDGAERAPDRWRFALPAEATVTATLSQDMEGEIRPAAGGEPVAVIAAGKSHRGLLPAGEWELAVRSFRRNHRFPYRVRVATDELLDGSSRSVALPAELVLAVGREGMMEIASFGRADVRARLHDREGARLADGDDRPGDWNFRLARRLAPGRYRIEIEGVAGEAGETVVTARGLAEREETAWSLARPAAGEAGNGRQLELEDEVALVPLTLPAEGDLVAVGARAAESLGLAVERLDEDRWRTLASAEGSAVRLALPRVPGDTRPLRLRLAALDRRPTRAQITGWSGVAPRRSEPELARGFEVPRLPGLDPELAVARVEVERDGCFSLAAPPEDVWTAAGDGGFRAAPPTLASVDGRLWIATPVAGAARRLSAARVELGELAETGAEVVLPEGGTRARCDVGAAAAVAVVLEAVAGDPWLAWRNAGGTGDPDATAAGEHRAVLVGSGESTSGVEMWSAGGERIEGRVSARRLELEAPRAAAWGTSAFEIASGHAVRWTLPAGAKRLRLALAPGALVALERGGAPLATVGRLDAPTAELRISEADALLIAGLSEATRGTIELMPANDRERAPIEAGAPYEQRNDTRGAIGIAVSPSASARRSLHVAGAEAALFVAADGSVARGRRFDVPAGGGTLRLSHGPGLVTAWIEESAAAAAPLALLEGEAREVAAPARLALGGDSLRFALALERPSLVSLRGGGAAALAVGAAAGGAPWFEVAPDGVALDAALPAGRAIVALRGVAGEPLAGTLDVEVSALEPLGEGLGAEVVLAPGRARGFAFRVERAGEIGAGVAAAAEVEALLFDASGRPLGRGASLWRRLEAGEYGLVLIAAATADAVRARPVVVGIAPPASVPPPGTAEAYLALERGAPPPVAGHAGTEAPARSPFALEQSEPDESEGEYGEEYDEEYQEGAWDEEGLDEEPEWASEGEEGP